MVLFNIINISKDDRALINYYYYYYKRQIYPAVSEALRTGYKNYIVNVNTQTGP